MTGGSAQHFASNHMECRLTGTSSTLNNRSPSLHARRAVRCRAHAFDGRTSTSRRAEKKSSTSRGVRSACPSSGRRQVAVVVTVGGLLGFSGLRHRIPRRLGSAVLVVADVLAPRRGAVVRDRWVISASPLSTVPVPLTWRAIDTVDGPAPMGHEFVGIVEEVGTDVREVRRRLVLHIRARTRLPSAASTKQTTAAT